MSPQRNTDCHDYAIGLDIGSTTAKIIAITKSCGEVVFRRYRRHHTHLAETAATLLSECISETGIENAAVALCGSGAEPLAQAIGAKFVQEVVANTLAVSSLYPQARCAIELGGQDAKTIFFRYDKDSGKTVASDMRMNGSCAGGTGAFIDEIAKVLGCNEEGIEALAKKGTRVYDISGRCGVFAKTDIQPLRTGGATSADLALSAFHAIVKQTVGGLAQGLPLTPPIIFEGGPLTYNPTLVRVFAERLDLTPEQVIVPDHPETIVANGAALSCKGDEPIDLENAVATLRGIETQKQKDGKSRPLFRSNAERADFKNRHAAEAGTFADVSSDTDIAVYIGIDVGSTTAKIALLNADGNVFDASYAHNDGHPIETIRDSLLATERKYRKKGQRLHILGVGATGYGEGMIGAALGADRTNVETIAHSRACVHYIPDATFLLDIGGQDMKAIWLDDGSIANIMLNEACSSGCGSFLETFASSLGVPVEHIAAEAFSSAAPAKLGSRCTVFMTSTVITEQRRGKTTADIMAGLCRSIIENVFTKVVRIGNSSDLGDRVVVQGGTFTNDAVLRALEEYLGRDVVRAPFPELMGAIGAALLCRDNPPAKTNFIGFNALQTLEYETKTGLVCKRCANACNRTVTTFSNGTSFVAGNKCPRGETMAENGRFAPAENANHAQTPPNLFAKREQLLFASYPVETVQEDQGLTFGLPRVLEFWDSMPFWSTFLRALGFRVVFSSPTNAAQYESGLRFVASDTACLPAKLVHGHVLDLCRKKVDRILFPHVMNLPPEGQDKESPYTCAMLMGYPTVVKNFQDPAAAFDVHFDTPVFHWRTEKDRRKQICEWARESFGIEINRTHAAFEQGREALLSFRKKMQQEGARILDEVHETGKTAIVLAGRPYHTDPFVSHGIGRSFVAAGMPVLTLDSLPSLSETPLDNLLPEITNNFHTRMLEGALIAANDPCLQYVQIVSFGCGHDAILTDEITRILRDAGEKHPLILKTDETDAAGSINIRIRSFVETIRSNRRQNDNPCQRKSNERSDSAGNEGGFQTPRNPYTVAFSKEDRTRRTVLIPNISPEISIMLRGAMRSSGMRAEVLPLGGTAQIASGKRYTHNDICFPCQMVIGEAICALQSGTWDPNEVAIGMVKFRCDCRMSHYAALLRKALDRAGFSQVPILTTDAGDVKGMHPGVAMLTPSSVIRAVWAAMMLDILQDIKRKMQPYEQNVGETERVFLAGVNDISHALEQGLRPALKEYRHAIDKLADVPIDASTKKPRVLVTGELLVTYHPGSNFEIERYLVDRGMETIFPRMTDQLRKDFICQMSQITDFGVDAGKEAFIITALFDLAQATLEKTAQRHPLFERDPGPAHMYEGVADIVPKTLSCGEGWLMAAEIAYWAKRDVRSFIMLQPFGCLPNHVCGRGMTKRLKSLYPSIQILPLDLDPDTSRANIENRLQMLIQNNSR